MSPSTRPIVKRQYGSRKSAHVGQTSITADLSSSPSSSSSFTLFGSSTTRVRPSLLSSDWDSVTPRTPPTSSSPPVDSSKRRSGRPSSIASGQVKENLPPRPTISVNKVEYTPSSASAPAPARPPPTTTISPAESIKVIPAKRPSSDLRSFFIEITPHRTKKFTTTSTSLHSKPTPKPTMSTTPQTSLFGSLKSTFSQPQSSSLEQLYLDPFTTPGHSTISCSTCGLSYARTPDDMTLHEKHHKRVVGGVEWVSSSVELGLIEKGKIVVLQEELKDKMIMVDPSSSGGAMGKKIKEVLSTIDRELGATTLTDQQLAKECKVVLVVEGRKVVAACLVQRMDKAHQVILESEGELDQKKMNTIEFSAGDEEGGAIFCDPAPVPTLLGIHRIWTCSTHRRRGLASRMLDRVADRFIYGAPIDPQRRRLDVAFSQPTGKGQALAKRWTGTGAFRVFVD